MIITEYPSGNRAQHDTFQWGAATLLAGAANLVGLFCNLFGTVRTIPQTGDVGWGAQVTNMLKDICTWLDGAGHLLASVAARKYTIKTETLAASGTITKAADLHRVSGSGGPVTLSATTAIADGVDGDTLILEGTSDANTVTILDAANTKLNGMVVLDDGAILALIWIPSRSLWVEAGRNR